MAQSISIPSISAGLTLERNTKYYLKNKKNGLYLSRMGRNRIQFSKEKADKHCQLTLEIRGTLEDGYTIVFKMSEGKYLSLMGQIIQDSKDVVDPHCKFRLLYLCNTENKASFALKGNNGLWLSNMDKDVRCSKEGIDIHCMLEIEKVV